MVIDDSFPVYFAALGDQIALDLRDSVALLRQVGFEVVDPTSSTRAVGSLPDEFLLGVMLSVRLARWESAGITVQREAGLPDSRELIAHVARLFSGPELQRYVRDLSQRARQLFYERFAWRGHRELGAPDIELVVPDDDALLRALADFLWAHRHS